MRVPFACVLLVGGLVGVAMPAFSDDEALGGTPEQTGDGSQGESSATLASLEDGANGWYEETAFDRQGDGHFYADVSVDGVSSRMLVDTGASVIALTGEDALAMGVYWNDADVGPVAQGANGLVYGVHVKLRHVRVGNFEATDVQAMVIPEGLGISLLGQSFLSTIGSVSIADDRMVLTSEAP